MKLLFLGCQKGFRKFAQGIGEPERQPDGAYAVSVDTGRLPGVIRTLRAKAKRLWASEPESLPFDAAFLPGTEVIRGSVSKEMADMQAALPVAGTTPTRVFGKPKRPKALKPRCVH